MNQDNENNAERLGTDNTVFDPYAGIEPRTRPDGTVFNWPYAVFAFHDCMEHPSLPCPACLNVEHEASIKKQG
jgi:hypothetical protein